MASSATLRRSARLQALLEGVELPAPRAALVGYAAREARDDEERQLVAAVATLPDRPYASLDQVAEALAPVQPHRAAPPVTPLAHAESGRPPGGDAYTDPHPRSGGVRHDAPPGNTPQDQLARATALQQEQQERRKQLG